MTVKAYHEVRRSAVPRRATRRCPCWRWAGFERLSRRRYWSGGQETLAIDTPALLALAIGARDAKCPDLHQRRAAPAATRALGPPPVSFSASGSCPT